MAMYLVAFGWARARVVTRSRSVRTAHARRGASDFGVRHYNVSNPVMAEVERQLLHESLDERRAITVEERDAGERPLLGDAVRKCLVLRPRELTSQGVVALLGRADHLAAQRRQIVLQLAERRPGGAFERGVDGRNGMR